MGQVLVIGGLIVAFCSLFDWAPAWEWEPLTPEEAEAAGNAYYDSMFDSILGEDDEQEQAQSETAGESATGDPNQWPNKPDLNIDKKISNQMEGRGWTRESIQNTYDDPYTTRVSFNKANGNLCTVYYNQDGSYVVVDNVTDKVIQISNRNNPNWRPDPTIIDPYVPRK